MKSHHPVEWGLKGTVAKKLALCYSLWISEFWCAKMIDMWFHWIYVWFVFQFIFYTPRPPTSAPQGLGETEWTRWFGDVWSQLWSHFPLVKPLWSVVVAWQCCSSLPWPTLVISYFVNMSSNWELSCSAGTRRFVVFVGLGSSVGWTPAGLAYVFAKGVSDQVRDPLTPRNSLQ